MAVPKRARLIKSRTRGNLAEDKPTIEEKPVSEEEHNARLEKLKSLGLIK